MSKVLEDEFNLPSLEEVMKELAENNSDDIETPETSNNEEELKKVANALEVVDSKKIPLEFTDGLEEHVDEADKVYKEAMSAFKNLMDFGMSMEPKNAGANAFAPATKFLELALKASRSKTDKKTERIKLALEKEKHDHELQKNQSDGVISDEANGSFVASRVDVLKKIRNGEFNDIE